MRSESSARRALHSEALSTVPLWFGSARGLKNVNRSGRLLVAGMLVTSAGKYGRGAAGLGGVPGAAVTAPGLAAGVAADAGTAGPNSASDAESRPAPRSDMRERTTGIDLIPHHRPRPPSIGGYV